MMMKFSFKIWNDVLDLLIRRHKNDRSRKIIEYQDDDLHYRLNPKSKSLTIVEPSQSITIKDQKFVNPDQRKLVMKLKKM